MLARRIVVALGGGVVTCLGAVACTSLLGDLPGGTLLDAGGDVTTSDAPTTQDGASETGSDAASEAASGGDSSKTDGAQGDGGAGEAEAGDPVTQISAGFSASCAVTQSGALYCWGANSNGAVGDGTTTARSSAVHITQDVTGGTLGAVAEVSAGFAHVCARMRDNSVYCWGNDDYGQLGDGVFLPPVDAGASDRHAPQKVPGVLATAVACGLFHTCVPAGSGFQCWGSNGYGELGHAPGVMGDQMVSIPFGGSYANATPLSGANVSSTTVAGLGLEFSCAVDTATGDGYCWGADNLQQLSQPTDAGQYGPNPSPVVVMNGPSGYQSDLKEVSAGFFHACAVDKLGSAYCWGSQGSGALGPGVTVTSGATSYAVLALNGVSHVSVGLFTTCAVDAMQHVQCWGSNGQGQLGHDPSTDPIPMCPDNGQPCNQNPGPITLGGSTFGPAKGVAVGGGFACALKTDGTVWCWGNAGGLGYADGGAGSNDAGLVFEPVQVPGLP